MTATSPGSLRADNLIRRFGALTAVDGISLEVKPGEALGLLGPNGAGKTTLLRMLATILSPDQGRIEICGIDAVRDPFAARRALGFASGDTLLYHRLTPREVMVYFARLHQMPLASARARAAELVESLGMQEFADRRCETLSAGQKQRANIARATVHDPAVVILDEPTSALDVLTGQFVLRSIREARAAGKAVIVSTHQMGEAEVLCDRVALIDRGRLLDQGTVSEVCGRAGAANLTEVFLARRAS